MGLVLTGAAPTVGSPASLRTTTVRAPVRLDLAGGWTDVPPYCDEVGGCVCNVAIARYATVRVGGTASAAAPAPRDVRGRHERLPSLAAAALRRMGSPPTSVDVWSDFPIGAGLGGSSAAGVALAAALLTARLPNATMAHANASSPNGPDRTHRDDFDHATRVALAESSRAVEVEEAGIAGGRQDHYAAAFGGALRLDFGADAATPPVQVTRLAVAPATLDAFARRAVVLYTGESRISSENITAVLDGYRAGEARVVSALARMRSIAREMCDAFGAGRLDDVGTLLGEHWTHQRTLHPAITTPRIDAIVARGLAAGALGAKALGASGGGCVLLFAHDDRVDELREAVTPLGEAIPVAVDQHGVTVMN